MILHVTFCIPAANGRHVAGVRASVVDAGRGIRTVEICEAVARLFAAGFEGISDQAVWTDAGVRAFRVLAPANNIPALMFRGR